MDQYHGTTILSVRRGSHVAIGGDGQVTLGNLIIKASARKVALLASRANFVLSVPMLMCMASAGHGANLGLPL